MPWPSRVVGGMGLITAITTIMAGITVGTTIDIGMRGVGRTTDNPVSQIWLAFRASRLCYRCDGTINQPPVASVSLLGRKLRDCEGGTADMTRRSLLTTLFVLIATTTVAAPPPVNPANAVAFMNHLWNRAAELLNNKTDPAIRQARFRQLFHEDFDSDGIARFVLG